MSITSKITLGLSTAFCVSVVYYVHYSQRRDRESMREGVIKDIQRQEMKKIQNLKLLQDQIEIAKALKEQQTYEQLSNREDHTNSH